MSSTTTRSYGGWRTATLVGIHVLFIAHFVHWKLRGRTLAPLEFNEVMYTIHQGIVTAGFILMAVVMVATLIFGRFFCSWGCHILALQDACGWIMDKLRIKRQPIRSRTLIWVPLAVMFYLFIWPQVLSMFHDLEAPAVTVVEAGGSRWSSFTTDNFWRNLPPPGIAVLTFFVCGFVIVYLLGSRGFCFQACPYGALFGIADQFAPGRIVLAKDCSQCGLCTKACTSDILVHRELALHGMVTNPRCLKDLDCIAACPEEAVQYGFRLPPLFRKGHPLGSYSGRFSFSLSEDIFLLVVFLISVFVYRGLYDAVPFLLAVGLAVCTAFVLVMAWRSVRAGTLQMRGVVLKSNGTWHRAGVVYGGVSIVVLLFLLHSGIVQFHTWRGMSVFTEVASTAGTFGADPSKLADGIAHYEKALSIGSVAPVDRRKELANLYLLSADVPKAKALLEGIVVEDPAHVEARYRLGEMAMTAGARAEGLAHWKRLLERGSARPNSRDVELIGLAALHVGSERAGMGDVVAARRYLERAADALPADPRPDLALSELERRSGRTEQAITLLGAALAKGADEALVRNNLGSLYIQERRWDQALIQYDRLALLRPSDADVLYALGVVQARTGDPKGSMVSLHRALQLDPGHERAGTALAMVGSQVITTNKNE